MICLHGGLVDKNDEFIYEDFGKHGKQYLNNTTIGVCEKVENSNSGYLINIRGL